MWQRLQEPRYAENMRYAQKSLDAALTGSASNWSSAPLRSDEAH